MAGPLMPKATVVWLIENTTLTFKQIAAFCLLHHLEVQAIADGYIAPWMPGVDPIANGQLTKEEIDRCEKDSSACLVLIENVTPVPKRKKTTRYTPVSKRQARPDGIAWILKHHPEVPDPQICRLLGTTKPTIKSIRDRTHWNSKNIRASNPVTIGLCTQQQLNAVIAEEAKLRPLI